MEAIDADLMSRRPPPLPLGRPPYEHGRVLLQVEEPFGLELKRSLRHGGELPQEAQPLHRVRGSRPREPPCRPARATRPPRRAATRPGPSPVVRGRRKTRGSPAPWGPQDGSSRGSSESESGDRPRRRDGVNVGVLARDYQVADFSAKLAGSSVKRGRPGQVCPGHRIASGC